jgi:hypothetical protein
LTTEFNFTGLHPAFLEAVTRHEPSIAFTLEEGVGRFVFLLFLRTDSKGKIVWGKQELFIWLARTQRMIRKDLWGNHKQAGNFIVYLGDCDARKIRNELGIGEFTTGPAFVLRDFLAKLNGMIPASIPLENKVAVIQEQREHILTHCAEYIEEADKVYLLRVGRLPPNRQPREETLRKLYMLDVPREDIAALIRHLKSVCWTAFWTATPPETDEFAKAFAKITSIIAGR